MIRTITLTICTALTLVACSEDTEQAINNQGAKATSNIDPKTVSLLANPQTGRWYSPEQVDKGKQNFAQYCAGCHGVTAESTPNWRTTDANGNYPPPPLNGTAHAWHHPLAVLDMVIRDGGVPLGGVMPAWGQVLNTEQRLELIASFQSYWPDKTYDLWLERELSSREE